MRDVADYAIYKDVMETAMVKRSVSLLEDRVKQTSSDKSNMEVSFQMEIQNIRSAQSKTLEMLMKYQSENDSLKSALADSKSVDQNS